MYDIAYHTKFVPPLFIKNSVHAYNQFVFSPGRSVKLFLMSAVNTRVLSFTSKERAFLNTINMEIKPHFISTLDVLTT